MVRRGSGVRVPAAALGSRDPSRRAAADVGQAEREADPVERAAGANTASSSSGQMRQRGSSVPVTSRIPFTARRAASFAPSIVAKSVFVGT